MDQEAGEREIQDPAERHGLELESLHQPDDQKEL
jgi:hypothetical protein